MFKHFLLLALLLTSPLSFGATTNTSFPALGVGGSGAAATAWVSYTPIFTGFGTVTSIEIQWRRDGEDVLIRGKFNSGTTTATEARISLPTGLTSASSSIIPSIQVAGVFGYGGTASSHGGFVLIEPGVTYLTFGSYSTMGSSSVNALTKANGDAANPGGLMSIEARVQVAGWNSLAVEGPNGAAVAAMAIFDSTCEWSTGNTSYTDSSDASCGFTTPQSYGFTSITAVDVAGSKGPGIVFTPLSATGKYEVCYSVAAYNASTGYAVQQPVNSGGTKIGPESYAYNTSNQTQVGITRCLITTATAGAASTVKLQHKLAGGTGAYMGGGVGDALTFTVKYLGQ